MNTSAVIRYEPMNTYGYGAPSMQADPEGEWVRWEDMRAELVPVINAAKDLLDKAPHWEQAYVINKEEECRQWCTDAEVFLKSCGF